MTWAQVTDLRGIIDTVEADAKLEVQLDIAKRQIEAKVGVQTGVLPDSLFLAHLYLTAVILLRFMQSSGELSYFSKMADTQTYNQIEPMIEQYTAMYQKEIKSFGMRSTSIQIPYLIATLPEDT